MAGFLPIALFFNFGNSGDFGNLLTHSRDLSNGECLAREIHPCFRRHTSSPLEAAEAGTQTVRHSPQSCRPFWGFPRGSQVLFLTAVPPAPLPSEHSVQYTKGAFPVNENLHSPRTFSRRVGP